MALNFNIPMPDLPGNSLLKGLQTGGDLYSKYMQPIIQREQIAQQQRDLAERGQYHQGSLEQNKAQLEQQWKQHLQDLALRQQTENRIGSLAPLQRQQLQFALQKAEREADPQKQMSYINQVLNGIESMNGQQGGQQSQQSSAQGISPFQGQGMPNAQQMENQVAPPSKEQIQQGFLSPQQRREMALNMMGVKIPKVTETPDQKRQREIETFKEKEAIKAQNKASGAPTSSVITSNQNIIQAANNIIPQIDTLIASDIPNQFVNMSPDLQKSYESRYKSLADGLMTAFKWPKTDQALTMAKDLVKKGAFESDDAYKKRLEELKQEVISRQGQSVAALEQNKISANPIKAKKETKTIDGKKYEKINGEWHEI